MISRRILTALTLAAAGVAVVVMALWGINALTAPFEDDEGDTTGATGPGCPVEDQVVKDHVARGEVKVSVYNTGRAKGRAQDTLDLLERAGFQPGEVGNGQDGDKVRRAEVRTTKDDDPEAQLVALALGPDVPVHVTQTDRGPGIDVFIGDRFRKLNPEAPQRVRLSEPEISCR